MSYRVTSMLLAVLLVFSAGCATHEQAGAATGAVVGGTVGHSVTRGSFIGLLVGAVIGATLGADIGRQMDEADRREAAWVLEHQRSGEAHLWRNPDTGVDYEMTPQPPYDGSDGPCRDFVVLTYLDGEPTEVHGTACRDPDGNWRAVNGD